MSALVPFWGSLFVGGVFTSAGTDPASHLAGWATATAAPGLPHEAVRTHGLVLLAPRPNPSGGAVVFAYTVPRSGPVTLAVYDVRGRLVARLGQGIHEAGRHTATWDGRDGLGRLVSQGVYCARLEAAGAVRTQRLVRLD